MISHDLSACWSQTAGLTKIPAELLDKISNRLGVLLSAARVARFCETELGNKGYLAPASLDKIKAEMDTWP